LYALDVTLYKQSNSEVMNPFSFRKINTEVTYETFIYVTRDLNNPHDLVSFRK